MLPWWGWVLVAGGALAALWLAMAFSSARSTLAGVDSVLGSRDDDDDRPPQAGFPQDESSNGDRYRRGA